MAVPAVQADDQADPARLAVTATPTTAPVADCTAATTTTTTIAEPTTTTVAEPTTTTGKDDKDNKDAVTTTTVGVG